VNDGSNDDDDDNNDNNDNNDEAIWESLDSDAAVVLLCVGCEDEFTLHVLVWRRCPTAIGSAERVSRRLLRKRPRDSCLLQNKFTRLILNANRKSKMLVVVMTKKETTQLKIKLTYASL